MRFTLSITALVATLLLTGCGMGVLAPATPVQPGSIQGRVHGGQQAVVGAHVYLYAANTAGYNIGASISLLTNSVLTNEPNNSGVDSNGDYYVTTDSTGSFNISNDYSCTPDSNGVPGQQVYLYAVGGNPGSGNNPAASFMAVLGDCPAIGNFSVATPYVWMNEVSTVAAAYAMAGFAYNPKAVSSSGTNLAKVGIKNAFANAANLVTLSTGVPLTTTPAGNGTVPQALLITLANTLAACVNSTGLVIGPPLTPNATPCYTLFTNAESEGMTGLIEPPTDTATAMINIAHNPGRNVAALYDLQSGMPAFGLGLTTQPNDFTMMLQFAGGGLNNPLWIAVDSAGNVWATNPYAHSISKLSSTGAAISPPGGYIGGGLNGFGEIAIDGFGNVWVANSNANSVSEFTNEGVAFPNSPYTGGGLEYPYGIAIDASGNVWMTNSSLFDSVSELTNAGVAYPNSPYTGGGLDLPAEDAIDGAGNVWVGNENGSNSLSKFTNAGVAVSPASGYTGGGLDAPQNIAIDSSGNVWVSNYNGDDISKFSHAGNPISPSTGYAGGGTVMSPAGLAIDGAGDVWVASSSNNNPNIGINDVSEFSNAGVALSPSTGYTGGGLGVPEGIAVDGSGNVWITNYFTGGGINELVGAATPVITPICAGLPATPTADGSSKLGTRP